MLKEFYNWVKTQTGEYRTEDNGCCPMAEFARTKGLKFPHARTGTVDECSNEDKIWGVVVKLAAIEFEADIYFDIVRCTTYEALVKRLELVYGESLA